MNASINRSMLYEPKLVTETPREYTYNASNLIIISYSNPHNEIIKAAKIYVGYQNLSGHLFHQINLTVDLIKANNSFIVWWNPSENISQDHIGEIIICFGDLLNVN